MSRMVYKAAMLYTYTLRRQSASASRLNVNEWSIHMHQSQAYIVMCCANMRLSTLAQVTVGQHPCNVIMRYRALRCSMLLCKGCRSRLLPVCFHLALAEDRGVIRRRRRRGQQCGRGRGRGRGGRNWCRNRCWSGRRQRAEAVADAEADGLEDGAAGSRVGDQDAVLHSGDGLSAHQTGQGTSTGSAGPLQREDQCVSHRQTSDCARRNPVAGARTASRRWPYRMC